MSNDLTIYSRYAHEWWTPGAPRFRSLQNITPFRLSLIDEYIAPKPGQRIADIGCGGGLISVPLIKRGIHMVGCDCSPESIDALRAQTSGAGEFCCADARSLPFSSQYVDHTLMMDLIDHIPDYAKALSEATRITKPGGLIFIGTINRTIRSYVLAIALGEGLRLIPPGTHEHRLFVRPDELIAAAHSCGLTLVARQGEKVLLGATLRRWAITLERGRSEALAYSMVFKRDA